MKFGVLPPNSPRRSHPVLADARAGLEVFVKSLSLLAHRPASGCIKVNIKVEVVHEQVKK